MKIIRLSTFLNFGGIETKMVNLSHYNDTENEWIFAAVGKGGVAEERILNNNKRTAILNLNYKIPSLKTIWTLYKYLKKERPDILHTSGAEANFFGFLAGRMAKVPKIIVEEIGIPNQSYNAKKIFGFIFKNADYVVGESQTVVNHIVSNYKLNVSKTKVIHNFGLFNYKFDSQKSQNDNNYFHIVMISRLEPVKNIEAVINVIAHLKDRISVRIKLTIAGSGTLEENLKNRVSELKLSENVFFMGFISDPYPILKNSDLYILNSFSEGFSNSLIEAMYSSTPSLSTDVGAASEIIDNNVNGFLIPAANEKVLLDRIETIISMPKERLQEIGMKGHQKITENFSLNNHIAELMQIYKSNKL